MTPSLLLGFPYAASQNEVVALPARSCLLFTDATSPTLEVSTDVGFSTKKALTLTNGAAQVSGMYVRATNSGTTVLIAKAL